MNTNNLRNTRKNQTGLIALTAFSVLVAAVSAFADTVTSYTHTYSTGDNYLSNWSVGYYRPGNYANPTANNQHQITNQNTYTRFDDNYYSSASWTDAKRTSKPGDWTADGSGWISPSYTDAKGRSENGFYFYKFDLQAASGGTAELNLSAMYSADDYLASVFMVDQNGDIVKTIYTAGTQTTANSQSGTWQNILATNFGSFEVNADDIYSLVFVVHNTNGGGSVNQNATGLNIDFTISGNIDFHVPPPATAATPEPATLALFGLGLAGLAAARRRRNK